MRLTRFADFGLRLLMRLAGAPDRGFATADLAAEFGVSRHHLAKVVARLSAAGLVETRRGGGGGLRLARPAEEVRLGQVVRLLEADQALVECLTAEGGACTLMPDCGLRARLGRAEAAFLADLDRSTLADCAWRPAPDGDAA